MSRFLTCYGNIDRATVVDCKIGTTWFFSNKFAKLALSQGKNLSDTKVLLVERDVDHISIQVGGEDDITSSKLHTGAHCPR